MTISSYSIEKAIFRNVKFFEPYTFWDSSFLILKKRNLYLKAFYFVLFLVLTHSSSLGLKKYYGEMV